MLKNSVPFMLVEGLRTGPDCVLTSSNYFNDMMPDKNPYTFIMMIFFCLSIKLISKKIFLITNMI